MEYTQLGSSDRKISRIALGTMSFGDGDSGREGGPICGALVEASPEAPREPAVHPFVGAWITTHLGCPR